MLIKLVLCWIKSLLFSRLLTFYVFSERPTHPLPGRCPLKGARALFMVEIRRWNVACESESCGSCRWCHWFCCASKPVLCVRMRENGMVLGCSCPLSIASPAFKLAHRSWPSLREPRAELSRKGAISVCLCTSQAWSHMFGLWSV